MNMLGMKIQTCFFTGRITGQKGIDDLERFWTENGLECPSDQDYLSVISKSYYQYPYIEFNGKFGSLDSATGVYRIGLEYGSGAQPIPYSACARR